MSRSSRAPVSLLLPAHVEEKGKSIAVRLLAPDVVLSGTNQPDKFGIEAVPVVLKPEVKIEPVEVRQTFNPAEFNPEHTKYIARSEKAKPMAVNMYSAFWTLLVCVAVLIGVSFFTEPKPDGELENLVMGLTKIPGRWPLPLVQAPLFLGHGSWHRPRRRQHHLLVRTRPCTTNIKFPSGSSLAVSS